MKISSVILLIFLSCQCWGQKHDTAYNANISMDWYYWACIRSDTLPEIKIVEDTLPPTDTLGSVLYKTQIISSDKNDTIIIQTSDRYLRVMISGDRKFKAHFDSSTNTAMFEILKR